MKIRAVLTTLVFLLGCSSPAVPTAKAIPDPHAIDDKGRNIISPKVDILFVIDNSGSMSSHQENLKKNFPQFLANFFNSVDIDFHIGVISTDDDPLYNTDPHDDCCGELIGDPRFVDRNTPDFETVLAERMVLGTSGSATEKVFDPVLEAFSEPNLHGINSGFLRSDATLAIIFVTDAEDQSKLISAPALNEFLVRLKGRSTMVLTYGVIVPKGVSGCSRDEGDPNKIEQLLAMSPSAPNNKWSLCDPLFGEHLAEMGEDLALRVGSILKLNQVPVISTIRVWYGTQELPPDPFKGWSFDVADNAIHIGPNVVWTKQPKGTHIQVSYKATKHDDKNP